MKRKNASINGIKKDDSPIVEFGIYKHFPLLGFLYSILVCEFAFLIAFGTSWIIGNSLDLSIKQMIIGNALCGIMFGIIVYLPSYISALIMNKLRKPILRFDIHGFYYTPQIWSRSKLYQWKDITTIEMGRNGEDELLIKVYLSNGKCVSINETILPIDYKELLTMFKYRLKDAPIKNLEW
jgi:hypothetical protein